MIMLIPEITGGILTHSNKHVYIQYAFSVEICFYFSNTYTKNDSIKSFDNLKLILIADDL